MHKGPVEGALFLTQQSDTNMSLNQPITTKQPEVYYYTPEGQKDTLHALRIAQDFTASVVHDLKNPLQTIMWLAEYLRKNKNYNNQEHEDSLEKILHCTREMNLLITNLLLDSPKSVFPSQLVSEPYFRDKFKGSDSFKKLPADLPQPFSTTLVRRPTDLNKLLHSIQQVFLKHQRPEIHLNSSNALMPIEEQILHRIFHNLMSNSVKHSNSERCVITVSAEVNNDQIEINYQDNGPGLPEKSLKILLGHHQEEALSSNKKSRSVSGNGLYIIRRLVGENGGRIISSKTMGPSEIRIIFPVVHQVKNSSHIPPWL